MRYSPRPHITCGSPRTGASAAGGSCDLTLPGKMPGNLAPPTASPRFSPPFAAFRPAAAPTALSRLVASERRRGGRAAVPQELRAAFGLVVLADRRGGGAQHVQGAEEAAVRLVLPRHRAVALPARPPQLVQAAVVAGPRKRVGGDRVVLGKGPFGQRGPGRGVGRETRRDLLRRLARVDGGVGLLVREQVGGGRL